MKKAPESRPLGEEIQMIISTLLFFVCFSPSVLYAVLCLALSTYFLVFTIVAIWIALCLHSDKKAQAMRESSQNPEVPADGSQPVSHAALSQKRRQIILGGVLVLIAVILFSQSPFATSAGNSMKTLNQYTESKGYTTVWRLSGEDDLYTWKLHIPDGTTAEELLQAGRWRFRLMPPLFESWSAGISVGEDHHILLYPGQNVIMVKDGYGIPSMVFYVVEDDVMEHLLQLITPTDQDTVSISSYQQFSQYI